MLLFELVLSLDKTEDGFNSILLIVSLWSILQQTVVKISYMFMTSDVLMKVIYLLITMVTSCWVLLGVQIGERRDVLYHFIDSLWKILNFFRNGLKQLADKTVIPITVQSPGPCKWWPPWPPFAVALVTGWYQSHWHPLCICMVPLHKRVGLPSPLLSFWLNVA